MSLRRTLRALVILAAAAWLLGLTAPAFALGPNAPRVGVPALRPNPALPAFGRGPVPAKVYVAGHALGGRSENEARAVILASVKVSSLPDVIATAGGKTYALDAHSVFYVDVEAMLDRAYASRGTTRLDLRPRYGYDAGPVGAFVSDIAKKTDRGSTDARWYLKDKRVKLQASVRGAHTDVAEGRFAMYAALKREAASGGAQRVAIPVTPVLPKVAERNLPRVILVVLSERYLRLYDPSNGGKILKGYRCAVGQPDYPTPTGKFKIVLKRYLPTWVNPGSDWGTGMPDVIGPGPGNPLGTRALNLNADGIRIHGTENIGSIGTAASHGCMRLVRHDIEELYNLVVVGTPVYIIN